VPRHCATRRLPNDGTRATSASRRRSSIPSRLGLEVNDPQELEVGGATLTWTFAFESGGDAFDLALVERPGRPTWLMLTGNHD
jgi:hypothetical protein